MKTFASFSRGSRDERDERAERGVALLAVLFALTLLMLLALPFAVSMGVGADAAMRDVEVASVEQASASVRELMLGEVVLSHPALDATPTSDGLDEYPDGVQLPEKFADLTDGGRVLLGGGVVDLQRYLALDSASPLLFANVLGTATRLTEELTKDSATMAVDDASALPDAGYLWVADELVKYASKQGNTLLQLERGLWKDQFGDGTQTIPSGRLVLDYRCVLASAWPYLRGDGTRKVRAPYRSVGEVAEIAAAGFGDFTTAEIDTLQRVFAVDTMAAAAATWGRPDRVFTDLIAGQSRSLLVRGPLHVGPGSTVRLRNLRTNAVEYALVMSSTRQTGTQTVDVGASIVLGFLVPVLQDFPATDTVVEPLIPVPVNVNTAPVEVLTALFAEVGLGARVPPPNSQSRTRLTPLVVGRADAAAFAQQIAAVRTGDEQGQGPFIGWKDFVDRIWRARFEGLAETEKSTWTALYRNLQTGRDAGNEMGTAPVSFDSGPWVAYRAAASRKRSVVAPGVVGRHERTGVAAAVPGCLLERRWAAQDVFEEAFRLDRRSPYWTTTPVNVGALPDPRRRTGAGADPTSRDIAHLGPIVYPEARLGEPRFPTADSLDAGITAAPASAPHETWPGASQITMLETFWREPHRLGRDVVKAGAYTIENVGPSGGGGGGGSQGNTGTSNQSSESFPFSGQDGFSMPFAISFWAQAKTLEGSVLFDHGVGDPDRNRLSLQALDGNLVFESIDEAGIDPNPSDSPAGVERTATAWNLPLAELALPADVPAHVSMSAYAGRPADMSFAIDGVTRGKAKYRTWLTAALKPFDPSLANNRGAPGRSGNDRYVDVQVESTEGFPAVGILRIGLELFEYSAINGNTFQCQWKDSLGGRGARQAGAEFMPAIPTDANGKPTVDIAGLLNQGVNFSTFPEHPVGAQVELYGYSAVLSENAPMMVGTTQLSSAIGAFAVARAFLTNARNITIQTPNGQTVELGTGIDLTWTGDLELGDPTVVAGGNNLPPPASTKISDAFSTNGGYALLMQREMPFTSSNSTNVGGIEVIRYSGRQGNKLSGVQRAQRLPGDDSAMDRDVYDGNARLFVTDWKQEQIAPGSQALLDDVPTLITWVVPISIAVSNTGVLWNPQTTGYSEWVQLYPKGADPADTEWVRYDCIEQGFLTRGNRSAWNDCYWQLTRREPTPAISVGNGGGMSGLPPLSTTPPWGTVTPTSGYVGYTPQLEGDFPQIRAARYTLRHRGDPMWDFWSDGGIVRGDPNPQATSSHPHTNSVVMQCHRLQLTWGNYGAYSARAGRNDRVALVNGSIASGDTRPNVEWHTVNWAARRFNDDTPPPGQAAPAEKLGPYPFQLVAFQAGVTIPMLGPAAGSAIEDPRRFDRVVKFPSGELPAAWCAAPTVGSGQGNESPMQGYVDELELTTHIAPMAIVDEEFDESAKSFRLNPAWTVHSVGKVPSQTNVTDAFPKTGGLVMIDGEIIAYVTHADGQFTVAANGRGLLNTEAKGHDRGARVVFLTHRPAAILTSAVAQNDSELPISARGALPRVGTVLLGQELLHYTWLRGTTEQTILEMPRWYAPGSERNVSQSKGLFRGRYGTAAQSGANNEAVIGFPFRYWDRHVERSDDPELAYSQLTTNEAPAYFRTLRWREETTDARAEVVCLVRTDSKTPWDAEPSPAAGLWLLKGGSAATPPHKLSRHGTRLEMRFATVYRPGAIDLASFAAHGWKSTARISEVVLEYDGQSRVFDEQVTAR